MCYGLTKEHKEYLPVRRIISHIGTYNFNLAKFWKDFNEKFKYTRNDSFVFFNRLSKRQLEENDFK